MVETRINRRWLLKIGVFFVVLLGLGVWGLVDALIVYPARGLAYAERAELSYLRASQEAGQLLQASVENPRQRLAELRERRSELEEDLRASRSAGGLSAARVQRQLQLLDWLTALSRVGALPEGPADAGDPTVFDDPRRRLRELDEAWQARTQPKPLSAYDIPLQWAIVALGFGGALWVVGVLVSVSRRRYRFDPESNTLTLPNGRTISPDDVREFDKRKWDKFFVTLRVKEGVDVKLDLLRYVPLEEWVLEMEKASSGASQTAGAPVEATPAEGGDDDSVGSEGSASPDAPDAPGSGGADRA